MIPLVADSFARRSSTDALQYHIKGWNATIMHLFTALWFKKSALSLLHTHTDCILFRSMCDFGKAHCRNIDIWRQCSQYLVGPTGPSAQCCHDIELKSWNTKFYISSYNHGYVAVFSCNLSAVIRRNVCKKTFQNIYSGLCLCATALYAC